MRKLACLLLSWAISATAQSTFTELWSDFDPRRDPLQTEVIKEWQEGDLTLRSVRFLVGTFREHPARLAAFYAFPTHHEHRLPGVMHIHGGGQRASLDEVRMLAAHGYAGLSVNWGGREMENAPPESLNTDWGIVDPTQKNVAGYNSTLPGPKQFYTDHPSPKNNNWYLLTLGCRRGLTFLEQQPEVDSNLLGVHGWSMGGNLTMYVAGTDNRVKAAVPGVGGSGWRWEKQPFIEGSAAQEQIAGDLETFKNTLSFESYAPHIHCPILHRSGTNDFHGRMDDVYRTNQLIPAETRYSFTPHLNHRNSPETSVTMLLWFDHFFKDSPALPATPESHFVIQADQAVYFEAKPSQDLPITRCEILYSIDPDPRARFWRHATVEAVEGKYRAPLLNLLPGRPVYAFANFYYKLPTVANLQPMPGYPKTIQEICLSGILQKIPSSQLPVATPTPSPQMVIANFPEAWQDWFTLNGEHHTLWQHWTRKVTDPLFRGPQGADLQITLTMAAENHFTVVLTENEWRSYRGPKKTYTCTRAIPGQNAPQKLILKLSDFQDSQGQTPASWQQVDVLGICAQNPESKVTPSGLTWQGPLPTFHQIAWIKN